MIPKIIYQTFPVKNLPTSINENVRLIKKLNSDFDHVMFDDNDIEKFICEQYGWSMLSTYLRIDQRYGAARADLFRYLLIYQLGGVYLDSKSSTTEGIGNMLRDDDQYILAKWRNGVGQIHEGAGMSGPMRNVPGGEFQQWHVIAAPKHPFLEAVISSVLKNIADYRPWRHGTGRRAVIRTTGPTAYSLAINKIISKYPHRCVVSEQEIGLKYTILESDTKHREVFTNHYSSNTHSIVKLTGIAKVAGDAYSLGKKSLNPIIAPAETIAKRLLRG